AESAPSTTTTTTTTEPAAKPAPDANQALQDAQKALQEQAASMSAEQKQQAITAARTNAEAAAKAAGLDVLTVGRHGDFLKLKRVEHERFRQRAEVETGGVIHEIDLPLAGDFQIANALVAAGLAIATGTEAGKALAALEKLKGASGRLELVGTTAEGAPVYVDYAHKPDALE
ncbi:Mur ligase family protein, partial [Rhizobiaceae sp. 2RAB30]